MGVSKEQDGFMLIIMGMLPFLLLIGGVAYYLDGRIEDIDEQLTFVPPASYEPPDLEALAADVQQEDFTERQLVYVPVYSHIYYEGGSPYSLEATLSLRNVDQDSPVYFSRIDYFDTEGKKVKSFLEKTIVLSPLETIEILVEREDTTGGSGANFVVEWQAETAIDKPLIEAVMVGTSGTNAICFSRTGIEISAAAATAAADQPE